MVTMEDERIYWDEGSASERTVLAWERTAAVSIVVAAIVLRAGIVGRLLALAIPVATVLLLASGAAWLLAHGLRAEHNRPFERGAIPHDRAIATVTVVTLIAAAGSAGLAIAG
jgi:uncharacterized membrane protein YidH (DUF202 family)